MQPLHYLRPAMVIGIAVIMAACGSAAPAPSGDTGSAGGNAPQQAGSPAAGSSGGTPKVPATALNPGEPKYGGIFRTSQLASAIAPHVDPQQSVTYAIHYRGVGIALSRLFQIRPETDPDFASKGTLEGDLAESWKQTNETTWEVKIRQGVKWQNLPPVNGRELVADDVIYSYKRQGTQGFANSAQVASIKEMVAVDKYTIKFTTKEPDAGFLMNLADGHSKIIAKETVELKGDLKNGPMIGTGPWVLQDGWDRKIGYKFAKNPEYFKKDAQGRKMPYLDGVEVVVIGDDAALEAAARSGQMTYNAFSPPVAKSILKDNPGFVLDNRPSSGLFSYVNQHMGLKSDKPPFNDVRVRQAWDKALDRQEIIDAVYFGEAFMNVGLALPTQEWHIAMKELQDYWKQDVPAAKKLLADAGFPNGLDVELTSKTDPTQSSIAELIVSQVGKAGFRAKIKPIDNPTYADSILTTGNFQSYNGTSLASAEANVDLYRFYYTGATGNTAGVADPALDKMIDQQKKTFNPEERKKLLKDIQWYVVKNAWYPHLLSAKPQRVVPGYVRNFTDTCCYDSGYYERIWFDK